MARIIRELMDSKGVDPQDIPRRFSIQTVHGRGICRGCHDCGNTWSTHLAWLTFDLRKQRISKKWKQKCQDCDTPNELWFPQDEIEFMVEVALKRVGRLQDGSYNRKEQKTQYRRAPHLETLCERCEYGRRQCWLGRR